MRLSWYANTGIAVFSIWQGGTCTGTFRLPLDDLSRLVDSLGRGLSDGPVQATGGQGATGPIALGGQRAPLAIGAAPMEAFTGAMNVLSDEQAAAYGVTRPPRPAAAQHGDGYAAWPGVNGFAPAPVPNGLGPANGYGQVNAYGSAAPNGYGQDVPDFGPAAVNGSGPAPANGYGPAANGFGPAANGYGPAASGYQSDNADYSTDPSGYGQISPLGVSQTGGLPVHPRQQDSVGQYPAAADPTRSTPTRSTPTRSSTRRRSTAPASRQRPGSRPTVSTATGHSTDPLPSSTGRSRSTGRTSRTPTSSAAPGTINRRSNRPAGSSSRVTRSTNRASTRTRSSRPASSKGSPSTGRGSAACQPAGRRRSVRTVGSVRWG